MTNTTSSLRFGYARVSTDGQDLALQVDALRNAQCQRIYSEVASSGKTRPQLDECLRTLREGDTLVVWRLDRLGRSLIELIQIIEQLQKEKIAFESLTEHISTTSATGKLTLQIFAALAEFERNIIRERTKAGLTAARARGRVGGRKPKVTDKNRREMLAMYDSKKIPVNDICNQYGITRTTFYKAVLRREYGQDAINAANEKLMRQDHDRKQ